ncbi:hypothetical protein Csa_013951 [Cucumis sativus]|uniref:Uncharacterized protein n=1 Tax=Cucumis sativus TaxID=3659 RepID=A0A0A0LQN6_CUCSA|nr:hypothetical protein Csa_013951 [Cucumis sativus]
MKMTCEEKVKELGKYVVADPPPPHLDRTPSKPPVANLAYALNLNRRRPVVSLSVSNSD